MISEKNLSILACPVCKGVLLQAGNGSDLRCLACDLAYPVINGIPVMLPDEATQIQGHGSRVTAC